MTTESLVFHHIGNATKSIEKSGKLLESMGYSEESPVIHDFDLGVSVQFWNAIDAPRIELVEPLGTESTVWKVIQKRSGPYHYAFESGNKHLSEFIKANRLKPITEKLAAKAFPSSTIQFFAGSDGMILELIVEMK